MFKESDLTPWFDGNTKPVRVGVYSRKIHGVVFYSFWDGNTWGFLSTTPKRAEKKAECMSFHQTMPWRGLAKDPQAPTPEELDKNSKIGGEK